MTRTIAIIGLLLILGCSRAETPATEQAKEKETAPSAESAGPSTEVGAAMPSYQTAMLDGTKFDIAAEKGNVVFLNVWATWCGPCRYEIPELQAMHGRFAGRGFKVVGVSVDEGEPGPVQSFVTEQKVTYPIAHDPDGKIATLLQTSVLPTSVLVDRNGKIVWKKYGLVEAGDESLAKAIEASLKQG